MIIRLTEDFSLIKLSAKIPTFGTNCARFKTDVSNSFSLKKTFLRNFPTNLLFSRLPSSSEMYCTPCSVQFRKDTRILLYFRKGKEKRPSSYFQVEIHVRTTEKFANSIARENFRRTLLNFFKQELSIRGIRLQHLVQKKKKVFLDAWRENFRDSSRLDIHFARGKKGRKIDKFVRESIDRLSNLTKGVSTKGVLVVVLALLVYSPFFAKKSMHLRYSVSRNPQR